MIDKLILGIVFMFGFAMPSYAQSDKELAELSKDFERVFNEKGWDLDASISSGGLYFSEGWTFYKINNVIYWDDKDRDSGDHLDIAYGGIRWESGQSRMSQYEHGQSRIGTDLWSNPSLYIDNSPIFGLKNINTPILMMHNDQDGAVPWEQGIELFMGMRRLGKPAWMLNYKGEGHLLNKQDNKDDFTVKVTDFFDYYLKDKPKPDWL